MPHVDREIADIGADREIGFLGGGQHRDAIVAVAKSQPGLAQFVAQRVVERVVSCTPIHRDGGDVIGHVVEYRFVAHA